MPDGEPRLVAFEVAARSVLLLFQAGATEADIVAHVRGRLAARGRIASGTSFEDSAKERNLSPADYDLGLVAKSGILDPAIADAAFSLPSGEVSQPVQGKFGVALVKVGVIQPAIEPDYASVAQDLKKEIAVSRARDQVTNLRDKMEDERGGGASVQLIKDSVCIAVTTTDNYGDFKFDKLDENSGRYTVQVFASGRSKTLQADLGASINLGEIRL